MRMPLCRESDTVRRELESVCRESGVRGCATGRGAGAGGMVWSSGRLKMRLCRDSSDWTGRRDGSGWKRRWRSGRVRSSGRLKMRLCSN